MGVHTHTHTSHNHTEICSRVLEGKNHPKVYTSTNSEEKSHKVLIVESFEGDDEKAQYANFKHVFIY